MRLRKYWKIIGVFCVSFLVAFLMLKFGHEFFSKKISGILFAILGVLTLVSGLWCFLMISSDISSEKALKREPTQEELQILERESRRLEVDDEKIEYFYGVDEPLVIQLSELKVIGEFTNESGPSFDDWFLILVKTNNEYYYIPAYAIGCMEAIEKLSEVLQQELAPQLFSSTTFESAVLFPKPLRNKKLFDFEGLHPEGIWNKLKTYIGLQAVTPVLRKDILEYKK